MYRSCGGDSKSSLFSFLAPPPQILAAEPFDWAMRQRGHQANYSARRSERTNARWNKFIIDADSEAFAGMSEHEAKGFWTSGAGHCATAQQINKQDDCEKYDKSVIHLRLKSFLENKFRGFFPMLYVLQTSESTVVQICSENRMGYLLSIIKKKKNIFLEIAHKNSFFWLLSFNRKKSRRTWRHTPLAFLPFALT